jgi:hypothetical protein
MTHWKLVLLGNGEASYVVNTDADNIAGSDADNILHED